MWKERVTKLDRVTLQSANDAIKPDELKEQCDFKGNKCILFESGIFSSGFPKYPTIPFIDALNQNQKYVESAHYFSEKDTT